MENTGNRISVLIPSYNRENYLEEALLSVLNQLNDGDELLIVDDGSTDHSINVLEKYQHEPLFRYIIKEHTNAPDTRNRAIQEAKSSWIVWLGSDDILMPGIVARYRHYISRFPDVDVFYGNQEIFGHIQSTSETSMVFRDYFKKNKILLQHLFFNNVIPDTGVMVRKQVYLNHGYYNCNFNRLHDYEFWTRTAPYINFKHCNAYMCKWRWHQGNMSTGSVQTNKKFNYMIVEKLLETYNFETLFPFYKGMEDKKSLAYCYLQIGKQYAKAASYPDAALKASQYLLQSVALKPFSETYFELLQLVTLQPEDKKQELMKMITDSLLEKAHRTLQNIKGRSITDKYKIASLNKRLGYSEKAELCFTKLIPILKKYNKSTLLAGVYFHLGEIYHSRDDIHTAKDYFQKCTLINPLHQKAKAYLNQ